MLKDDQDLLFNYIFFSVDIRLKLLCKESSLLVLVISMKCLTGTGVRMACVGWGARVS